MNDYEAKQERRRDRLQAAADRAKRESEASYGRARDILDVIPPGQPVLVGHHSERGHRAALRRADNAMRRGVEASNRAAELRHRATAVGKGGVSSDDPDAVEKLREKLAKLRERREGYKAVNAAYRKAGKPSPDDGLSESWRRFAELAPMSAEGIERLRVAWLRAPWEKAPVASYMLTNLGANIRRIEKRIGELEQRERVRETLAEESVETRRGEGWRLVEAVADNRIRLYFDAIPPPHVRQNLKSQGWRWARSEGAWQRHLNHAGRASAEYIVRNALGGSHA